MAGARVPNIASDVAWSDEIGSSLRTRLSNTLTAEPGTTSRTARGFSTILAWPTVLPDVKAGFNPVLIVAFLYFKSPLDVQEVSDTMRQRLCAIPRLRSRIRSSPDKSTGVDFVTLSDLELNMMMPELVREQRGIKNQKELDALCSQIYQDDMDPAMPLWRIRVINGMDDGRSVLMFVADHAIGDGVAMIQVLMSILDDQPGLPIPSKKSDAALSKTTGGCGSFLTKVRGLLQSCWGPFIGDQLPADPPNRLKSKDARKPGKEKAQSMTSALTMAQIKKVKEKIPGATVNDVLMTMTALTLQEYFKKYDPKALRQKVRGNFPINLRTVTKEAILSDEHFGNRFSQGQLRFPLRYDDPMQIFAQIKGQIDVIKVSPEPIVRDNLLSFLALRSGLKPKMVSELILDAFGKVTAMLSNVPGPLEEVKLMGRPLDDLAFYALAPIGLYFGIVQYKGNFKAGICCDAACEPEPAKLAACWDLAYQRLAEAASKLP